MRGQVGLFETEPHWTCVSAGEEGGSTLLSIKWKEKAPGFDGLPTEGVFQRTLFLRSKWSVRKPDRRMTAMQHDMSHNEVQIEKGAERRCGKFFRGLISGLVWEGWVWLKLRGNSMSRGRTRNTRTWNSGLAAEKVEVQHNKNSLRSA